MGNAVTGKLEEEKEHDMLKLPNVALNSELKTDIHVLTQWNLKELRRIFEFYLNYKYGPYITQGEFKNLLGLMNLTSINIFNILKDKKKVSFYELLITMAVFSFANYHNKVRFIFNVIDFEGISAVYFDAVFLMVSSILKGASKFTPTKLISVDDMKRIASNIFTSSEFTVDSKITIHEIGQWVDNNDILKDFFLKFEPKEQKTEETYIFLPIKRMLKVDLLLQTYLFNKSDTTDHSAKVLSSCCIPPAKPRKLITVNGNSYSKKDVLQMKINFDEMNTSKTGVVTLDEYLKANETNSFLKKFSVNLFKFIDKDGKGFTFRKFLKRIVPGATKEHLEIMEGWVASEDLLKQRAQKNYKESADIGTNEMHKTRQALSTRQIKDVIQMFVMIDKAGKGYLVLPELIEAYKAFTSEKSVTAQFQKSNKAKDGKLLLPEYIEMMFPPELYVSEIVMKNFVIPFYNSIKK